MPLSADHLDRLVDRFVVVVRATINGLMSQSSPADIAAKRGKTVEEILG